MNSSLPYLTQQIKFLSPQHLEELHLFIEFLMNKQQKAIKEVPKPKGTKLLGDIMPLDMPVSDYVIQRDMIYEDRI
jgi:Protein of unknown function (DUF2281)